MPTSIYHNLEQMVLVACAKAKEYNCNMNVIISNARNGKFDLKAGSTYEMVGDSYFHKERPNVVLLHRTDDLLAMERIADAPKFWQKAIDADLEMYFDGEHLNTTVMGEGAAKHFRCETDEGKSEAEERLFEMAVEYAEKNERWLRAPARFPMSFIQNERPRVSYPPMRRRQANGSRKGNHYK